MKRIFIPFLSVACLVLVWNVYSQHADSKTDLFHYKHSVVGNNSAVTNIVKELAHHQELRQIALQTKQTPYGIHLTYKDIETENIEQEIKETVLFNATYLFVLVDNVDRITFTFPDYKYTVTRDQLDQLVRSNSQYDQTGTGRKTIASTPVEVGNEHQSVFAD